MAQKSSAPRSQEDYITQVAEEIEGRVRKRLSKELSRTENRILGALARLGNFLMNPLLPGCSGTIPEPSRNALNTSQGTNEDDSQNDPHPEAGLFHGQMAQNSGPEDGRDNILPGKYVIFLYFLAIEQNFSAICRKLSGKFFKTAFHVSKETLFWKQFLKKIYFNTSGQWTKKCRLFVRKVSVGWSKQLSLRP